MVGSIEGVNDTASILSLRGEIQIQDGMDEADQLLEIHLPRGHRIVTMKDTGLCCRNALAVTSLAAKGSPINAVAVAVEGGEILRGIVQTLRSAKGAAAAADVAEVMPALVGKGGKRKGNKGKGRA